MKRNLLMVIIMLLAAVSTSLAKAKSDPYIEDPSAEWGDVNEPTAMWSPHASTIHAGRLGAADDVDAFSLEFDAPTPDWPFQVMIPACDNAAFEDFFPSIAVIGKGLQSADTDSLPFGLPEGSGAVIYSEDFYKQQYAERDFRSIILGNYGIGQPIYFNTARTLDIPEAGEYIIAVFEPDGHEGAYMLVTGDNGDSFAPRPQDELQAAFNTLFDGSWMGTSCDVPVTQHSQVYATMYESEAGH